MATTMRTVTMRSDSGIAGVRDTGREMTRAEAKMTDQERPTRGGSPDLDEAWKRCVARLRREVGEDAVEQWIIPIQAVSLRRDLVALMAPTQFVANWVEKTYGDRLLRYLQDEIGSVRRMTVRWKDEAETDRARKPAAVPPATAGDDRMLRSAALDPRFTFDSFVVGKPNELAHAAARRVAETCDASFNPVFLYGGVGLGKTHLMHAIAHHLSDHFPARRVLYLSAEQFMYRFVQALRFRDTMTFKTEFRSVDVLMIDDVQFIAGKDSTQEEFFHTFNALIDQNKQIVISADRSPDRIDGLEERICSRLQWGLVVDIHPTDYELRLGILQTKAEAMAGIDPDIRIEPKVLEFLAQRISSNVRVLEGALTRLFAFATLVRRNIDLELTHDCLSDLLRSSQRKVTIDEIKRHVAEHYNLRMADLVSARRSRAIARPRQVAMFLAKTLTPKSLPEIGRGFGGRDHTTVIHAVRKIEELREKDSQLNDDLEQLRRMLEG